MSRKPYTRDSIERALIHHGIDYSPPYVGHPQWRVGTGVGTTNLPEAMVYAYTLGLADGERKYKREETLQQ